jgi:hypothetical protein
VGWSANVRRCVVYIHRTKMAELKEYCIVRVVKLSRPIKEYDDWGLNQRNPQIGDTGTLIDKLHAPNLADKYVVESTDDDGKPIWLSDFFADEIEPINAQHDCLG